MHWRWLIVAWHRDLGYLAGGLTLAYAISGIAVNHREHWDYNRSTQHRTVAVGRPAELLPRLPAVRREQLAREPRAVSDGETADLVTALASRLGRAAGPRNAFWRGPEALHLYFDVGDSDTVVYRPHLGTAELIGRHDRWVLRDLNFLHLNEGRRFWTYAADAYALGLAALVLTGIFIARGRRGLRGRGGVLLCVGIALPALALVVLRYA